MSRRRRTRPAVSLAVSMLLATLLTAVVTDVARAQAAWPPWQSYGESEATDRARQRERAAKASQAEIEAAKKKVDQLRTAGKYAEAATAQQRVVKLTEKRYGPNDPQTAAALTTLADLYGAQNKFAEAEPLLKRAITIHEKAKKPDNGEIAQALDNLSSLYVKQGRTADAAPLAKRAADLRANAPAAPADTKVGAGKEETPAGATQEATPGAPAEAQAKDGDDKGHHAKKAKRLADKPGEAPPTPMAPAPAEAPAAEAPAAPSTIAPAEAPTAPAPGETTGQAPPAETAEQTPPADATAQGIGAAAPPPAEDAAPTVAPPGLNLPHVTMAPPLPPPPPTMAPAPLPQITMTPPPSPVPPPVVPAPKAVAPEPGPDLDKKSGGGGAPPTGVQPQDQAAAQAQAEDARRAVHEEEARSRAAAEGAAQARKLQAAPKPPAAVTMARPGAAPPLSGGAAPPDAAKAPPPPMAAAPSAPPAAAAGTAEEQKDWDVVPVFYGTDRAVEPNAQRLMFGSDRGRRLQLGQAFVTVPKVHQVPQVERPWAVKIPYFDVTIYEQKEDPKQHFTIKEIKALTKEQLLALVKARLKPSQRFKDHAIVFVHGYNTSFDNALYRTAQIAYDLEFDGAAFLYSWPSGGGVASYTYDRESAQASEPYLRQFLEMVVKETGAKSVSIIAHSMGNQPVMDVLRDMKSSAPPGVTISQVILAAPDVDADNFTNLAQAIKGFAKGVTLYASSNDRALLVSRNFWGNYRAGDVPTGGPLVLPGIDTIDVTDASTDAFAINHSGYAQNNKLLQDIGKLVLNGLRPPDLRLPNLKKVATDKGDYWRYVK
jgi:esterase/lipase superfamily enzyme/tetratricopeptide (TPR) repeat protein